MASSEMAIDTTALNRDIGTLSSTLRRVEAEVEGMYGAIQSLDRMWDGPANEAFVQQFRRDYANMQALFRAVQSLIQCMRGAGAAYASGEKRVESIVSSIRI